MNWGSWSNFWHMGGYGFYVWGSYAVALVCIIAEIVLLAQRKRTLLRQLTQMLRLARKERNETPF
jgi:heme exporter protein D